MEASSMAATGRNMLMSTTHCFYSYLWNKLSLKKEIQTKKKIWIHHSNSVSTTNYKTHWIFEKIRIKLWRAALLSCQSLSTAGWGITSHGLTVTLLVINFGFALMGESAVVCSKLLFSNAKWERDSLKKHKINQSLLLLFIVKGWGMKYSSR